WRVMFFRWGFGGGREGSFFDELCGKRNGIVVYFDARDRLSDGCVDCVEQNCNCDRIHAHTAYDDGCHGIRWNVCPRLGSGKHYSFQRTVAEPAAGTGLAIASLVKWLSQQHDTTRLWRFFSTW